MLVGCGYEPRFDTPEATVEAYVWAYNNNDQELMSKCGFDTDVNKLFRVTIDVGVSEARYDVVQDIQAELLEKQWARPKTTSSYTTDRALLTYRFTSKSDPTFDIESRLLLVKRRSSFTDFRDPIRWQLMPLKSIDDYDV